MHPHNPTTRLASAFSHSLGHNPPATMLPLRQLSPGADINATRINYHPSSFARRAAPTGAEIFWPGSGSISAWLTHQYPCHRGFRSAYPRWLASAAPRGCPLQACFIAAFVPSDRHITMESPSSVIRRSSQALPDVRLVLDRGGCRQWSAQHRNHPRRPGLWTARAMNGPTRPQPLPSKQTVPMDVARGHLYFALDGDISTLAQQTIPPKSPDAATEV
jgi:hypothetical protein